VRNSVLPSSPTAVGDGKAGLDHAQQLGVGCEDEHAAGARREKSSFCVDPHAIRQPRPAGLLQIRGVEEHPTLGRQTIRTQVIGHDHRPLGIRHGDIETLLVGRQGQTVREGQLVVDHHDLAGRAAQIDPVERQLLDRRGVQSFQAVRRIGEVDRVPEHALAGYDQIVGAVEPLALETVDDDRLLLGRQIDLGHGAVAMITDQQLAGQVQGHAVRARLAEDLGRRTVIAGRLQEDRLPLLLAPPIHRIGGHVGEQEVLPLPDPHRSLRPGHAVGQLLDHSARRDDRVQLRGHAANAADMGIGGRGLRGHRSSCGDQGGAGCQHGAAGGHGGLRFLFPRGVENMTALSAQRPRSLRSGRAAPHPAIAHKPLRADATASRASALQPRDALRRRPLTWDRHPRPAQRTGRRLALWSPNS
jgi:hypothetical protein